MKDAKWPGAKTAKVIKAKVTEAKDIEAKDIEDCVLKTKDGAKLRPLKIAVVAGEESGDLLGADLVDSLRAQTDQLIDLVGVGGKHLQERGLQSLFNPEDIALMGLSSVLKNLPKLIFRIRQTANAIIAAKPDILLIIDSPDFTHRVAKRVKAANPSIPIIKYIAPTVWAWRPQRAKAMKAYVDHILTVLPFEVEVLKKLNGPAATYVGHRLSSLPAVSDIRNTQIAAETKRPNSEKTTLLVLPGSRRSEIQALMPVFGDTVSELSERINNLEIILPTLPHQEPLVRELCRHWHVKPQIVIGTQDKWKVFAEADIALAASGTVALELALCRIPSVIAYKTDWFARQFLARHITIWSASLPNIIADEPILPEYFDFYMRSGALTRQLQRLSVPGPARQAQLDGFTKVEKLMATERPAGEIAAEVVLQYIK